MLWRHRRNTSWRDKHSRNPAGRSLVLKLAVCTLRSHHCLNNLFLPFFLLESRSHPHTVNGLRKGIGEWEERHTYEHIHVRLARLYYATYVLKAQRARCKSWGWKCILDITKLFVILHLRSFHLSVFLSIVPSLLICRTGGSTKSS